MPEHLTDTLEAGDRFERGTAVLRQIGGREFDAHRRRGVFETSCWERT
jgi:hypothetical protein